MRKPILAAKAPTLPGDQSRQTRDLKQTPVGRRVFLALWFTLTLSSGLTAYWAWSFSGLFLLLSDLQVHFLGSFDALLSGLYTLLLTFLPLWGGLAALAWFGVFGDRHQALPLLKSRQSSPAYYGPMLLLVGGLLAADGRANAEKDKLVIAAVVTALGVCVATGAFLWLFLDDKPT